MKLVWILVLSCVCFGASSAYGQYYVPYAPAPVYVPYVQPYYVQPQVYVQPYYVQPQVQNYYYYQQPNYPTPYYGYGYPRFMPGQPVRNFFRSFYPVATPY